MFCKFRLVSVFVRLVSYFHLPEDTASVQSRKGCRVTEGTHTMCILCIGYESFKATVLNLLYSTQKCNNCSFFWGEPAWRCPLRLYTLDDVHRHHFLNFHSLILFSIRSSSVCCVVYWLEIALHCLDSMFCDVELSRRPPLIDSNSDAILINSSWSHANGFPSRISFFQMPCSRVLLPI